MTKTLRAYHSDPKLKRKFMDRVRRHRAADELIQGATEGKTPDGFRGCAVVCTMNVYDHGAYETEIGVPRILACLEDRIFEGLSKERAMEWPTRFLRAIPVGGDLSMVWPAFAHWLLIDEKHGVIRHAKTDQTREAIRRVAALFERQLAGASVTRDEWNEARSNAAAAAAAAYAAYAAYAATAYAAYAADAYAATATAAYAATAAAAATATATAAATAAAARLRSRRAHFAIMADKMIDLLAAAPVKKERAA